MAIHQHNPDKNISIAFFLNTVFTVIELIGGFYTNSFAILSDALHDLGDSISLGLAWYFQRISKKGRTEEYSYGYKRFNILGALISAIILIIGSLAILYNSIPALWNPNQVNAEGMMYFAIGGVVFNGFAAIRMASSGSINEKMVFWHLIEDVMGWVAVLIASIVMLFINIPILDPLLSILISLFIVYNVFRNLKKSLNIFLQATPDNISESLIREKLKDLKQIKDIHDCHAWSMDGNYNILTLHVVLNENMSLGEQAILKMEIRKKLNDISIQHLTLEFESDEEDCTFQDC